MLSTLKKLTLGALLVASFSQADGGDLFDIRVGAGVWDVDTPTGIFGQDRTNTTSLENDFGIQDGTANYMWAEFQHAIPLIPHIRVEYAAMAFKGSGSGTFNFGGYSFTVDSTSELVLDNVDAIAFWDIGIMDMVDFNFGVGAKAIVGQLTSTATAPVAGTQVIDIGAPAIYAYLNVRANLPLGLGVEVEHKEYPGGVDLQGAELEFTETIAKVDYTLEIAVLKLGVEAGYRSMDLDLLLPAEDKVYVNVGLSGTFVGAFLKLEI